MKERQPTSNTVLTSQNQVGVVKTLRSSQRSPSRMPNKSYDDTSSSVSRKANSHHIAPALASHQSSSLNGKAKPASTVSSENNNRKELLQPVNKSTHVVYQPKPEYIPSSAEGQVKENKESVALLWFDPNIDSSQSDIEHTKAELRLVNDLVVFHTNLDQCISHIRSIEKEKVLLVVSGAVAVDILQRTVFFDQVDSIYIFCLNQKKYENLRLDYKKLSGIYTKLNDLIVAIKSNTDLLEKQEQVFNFYDQNQRATRDLSKESAEFIWFQMFNDVILQLPRDDKAREDMLNVCRRYYRGNAREMAFIDEFDRTFSAHTAIQWYTRETFVYKMVNKALRTEDIDQLYTFRLFIGDLCTRLAEEHQKIINKGEKIVVVYRGVRMSQNEIDKLKQNEGKLTSTNGFLSTSRLKKLAMEFALRATNRTDTVSVLFQIECDVKKLGEKVVFADIAKFSEFEDEQEVLFDLATAFFLDSVKKETKSDLWIVKMRATSEGKDIAREYIDENRKYLAETNVTIFFGRLLYDIGQFDKSKTYFEQMLNNQSNDDEQSAAILRNIARAQDAVGDYAVALKNYEQAYALCSTSSPKDTASTLDGWGAVFHSLDRYEEALDCYTRAFEIRKSAYGLDHPVTADSLLNLGSLCDSRSEFDQALAFYLQALNTQKKCLPKYNSETARSLTGIGGVYWNKGDFDNSLKFYLEALEMRQKCLPAVHSSIATNLMNIALVYSDTGHKEKALDYYMRSLAMCEKCLPSNHPSIALILHNIGCEQTDNEKALEYYFRSLKMKEKCLPENHTSTAMTLVAIGNTLAGKGEDHEGTIDYLHRALKMYEICIPAGDTFTAFCLYSIGRILNTKEEKETALQYLNRALEMQERFLPVDHLDIAYTLTDLGTVCEKTKDLPNAIRFHSRALDIRKKLLRNDKDDIGYSLDRLAWCYDEQGDYDRSLEYFLLELEIYEKCVPGIITDTELIKKVPIVTPRSGLICHLCMPFRLDPKSKTHFTARSNAVRDNSSIEESSKQSQADKSTHISDKTRTLDNIGYTLRQKGNNEEALKYYLRSLKLKQTHFAHDIVKIADALENVANVHSNMEKYDLALEYRLTSLSMRERLMPENPIDIAEKLTRISLLLVIQNKNEEALTYMHRSLECFEKYLLEPTRGNLMCLFEIGEGYVIADDNDRGLECFLRCLKIQETSPLLSNDDMADIHDRIGQCYVSKNDHRNGLSHHLSALDFRKKCSRSNDSPLIGHLTFVGTAYHNLEQYDEALDHYLHALNLYEKYSPNKPEEEAATLQNIARLYHSTEKYGDALKYYNLALKLQQKCLSESDLGIAETFYRIGITLKETEEVDQALDHFFKASELYKKSSSPPMDDFAAVTRNIAQIYYDREEYESATEYRLKAVSLLEKCSPIDYEDVVDNLLNTAWCYSKNGHGDTALEYCKLALATAEKNLANDHLRIALSLQYIGNIYQNQEDYESALECRYKELKIRETNDGDNTDLGTALYRIGESLDSMKELARALEYYSRCVVIIEKCELSVEYTLWLAVVFFRMANIYSSQQEGNNDKALEYARRALELREKYLEEGDEKISLSLSQVADIHEKRGEIEQAESYRSRVLSTDNDET